MINSVFSKVYYINLDGRTARKEQIEEQLNRLGIEYERYPAVKGSPWGFVRGLSGPELGCIGSHLNILKLAKEQQLENVLILEDDAVFCKDFYFKFYEAYRNVPKDWQLIYLGGNNNTPFNGKISHKLNTHVLRSLSTLTTASYAVNKSIYDLLIERILVLDKTLDLMYISIQPQIKAYCFYPALVTQRAGYSDIQSCFVDYGDCIK